MGGEGAMSFNPCTNNKEYEDYLNSDCWVCRESPTQAHYWRRLDRTVEEYREGLFKCRHCGEVRKMVVGKGSEVDVLLSRGIQGRPSVVAKLG